MSRPDHISCVAHHNQLLSGYAWCGREIHEFTLTGIDHAVGCIVNQSYAQPCPDCVKVIKQALEGDVTFEELRAPVRKAGIHFPEPDRSPPAEMPKEEQIQHMQMELEGLREINAILSRQHYKVLSEEEKEGFKKYQPDLYQELFGKTEG